MYIEKTERHKWKRLNSRNVSCALDLISTFVLII